MFKFRSNSGQKCSPEQEPEQKGCSGTGTGISVDLWLRRCCPMQTFSINQHEQVNVIYVWGKYVVPLSRSVSVTVTVRLSHVFVNTLYAYRPFTFSFTRIQLH